MSLASLAVSDKGTLGVSIDGKTGTVTIDPDEQAIASVRRNIKQLETYRASVQELAGETSATSDGVAWFAHIGGFVAGMVLAVAYKFVLKEPLLPGSARVQPWDRWYQAGRPRD